MNVELLEILKEYWGHKAFRPAQEDIIESALASKDTLALLPTGGGKSICFQIPVMAQEGMGIVVSPLIALMNDQVLNLKNKGISAIAITSALSFREIDLALENAANGKYKFLYLSPERLKSEIVVERIKRMNVKLIAIDEAHCISQWGYDFRPSYLEIPKLRELLPEVPVLALTATATPKVVKDIQDKLAFKEGRLISKSFHRPNLHYNILKTERKWAKTLEIFNRIPGSGIIYSRNRKNTVEIADWLKKCGVSADYYHAGLDSLQRQQKQEDWLENKTRIMVCTNAFGMGIDKPDVRIVIHLELPDSLESYFQEAGRAGRDEQTAYSIVIVDPADVEILKGRYLNNYPDLKFVRKVYQALGNYLQLATGSGENDSFDFDLNAFTKQYGFPALKAYNTLKILEKEGILLLSENFGQASRLLFKADRTTIYDYQLRNPNVDALIKVLFRSYGGLDIEYTSINEWLIAQRLKSNQEKVIKALKQLHQQGMIDYIPGSKNARLNLLKARQKAEYLTISDENLKNRFEDLKSRIESVTNYVEDEETCRSRKLLLYFGENMAEDCGHCDVCRRRSSKSGNQNEIDSAILNLIHENPLLIEELVNGLAFNKEEILDRLRWLMDQNVVREENQKIYPID